MRKPLLPARVIYPSGSVADHRRMKPRPVEETRLINARRLAKSTEGGIAGMAKRLDKSQSQWQNTIGKTPMKQIGADVAREIEGAYGHAAGWLDMPWDLLPVGAEDASLEAPSGPKDTDALQWIAAAMIGYLFATQPDEGTELVAALEGLPKEFRATGPGEALLEQLVKMRGGLVRARRPRRGTGASSRSTQP